MRIETQVPKNKVFKTQVPKTYLTLIFNILIMLYNLQLCSNVEKYKKGWTEDLSTWVFVDPPLSEWWMFPRCCDLCKGWRL
jgi:hypothetical protein